MLIERVLIESVRIAPPPDKPTGPPMVHLTFAVWLCSQIGLSCAVEAVPSLSTIQTAYEREASAQSSLHDAGLKVLQSKCHGSGNASFLCEVTFMSVQDPTERLYFDIVAVTRTGDGWVLKSGLCKR